NKKAENLFSAHISSKHKSNARSIAIVNRGVIYISLFQLPYDGLQKFDLGVLPLNDIIYPPIPEHHTSDDSEDHQSKQKRDENAYQRTLKHARCRYSN